MGYSPWDHKIVKYDLGTKQQQHPLLCQWHFLVGSGIIVILHLEVSDTLTHFIMFKYIIVIVSLFLNS